LSPTVHLVSIPGERRELILDTITSYASISEANILNTLFKQALKKLLENSAVEGEEGTVSKKEEEDEADTKKDKLEKSYVLSDIVFALCTSLDLENLTWLYRSISSQLVDPDSGMQKRAYKILAAICGCSHASHRQFFVENWKAIVEQVNDSTAKLTSAATKTRIACIKAIVLQVPFLLEQPDILSILPSFLGEILLSCKEASGRTREAAFELLIELGKQLLSIEDSSVDQVLLGLQADRELKEEKLLFGEYLCMIIGGLAGNSPHMQSATILALSRLLYEFKRQLKQSTITSILTLILPLFQQSKNREIIKSIIGFIKVCVLSLEAEQLRGHLNEIVTGMCIWCHTQSNRFKTKIRVLFEILIRKYSIEHMKTLTPEQHHPLLDHIKKTKEREKRQKAAAWKERHGKKGEDNNKEEENKLVEQANKLVNKPSQEYEAVLYGSDNEEDGENDEGRSGGTGRVGKTNRRQKKEKNKKNTMLVSDSADTDSLDFLSSSASSHLISSKQQQRSSSSQSLRSNPLASSVQTDKSGKFVFTPAAATESKQSGDMSDEEGEGVLEKQEMGKGAFKRKGIDFDNLDGDDEEAAAKSSRGSKRQMVVPGSQYAARTGSKLGTGGDSKKKGQKFEPYAYLALDPMALNKRNKGTAAKKLGSIVAAAKKGAGKGTAAAGKQAAAKFKGTQKKQKKHK